jgi:guanine deaminase
MMASPAQGAPSPAVTCLQGDLLDFAAAPAWGEIGDEQVRWRPGHWLQIDAGGRITAVHPPGFVPPQGAAVHAHPGRLLMPGFIDTHVHSPQLGVIASFGTELLDWLNRYTFPAERAFAEPAVAVAGAERFLDALLAHGTTCAAVFPTVHKVSAEALFDAAARRGMAIVTGKVLMDRNAPDGLRDDVAGAERDCLDLIGRWHRRGRAHYAVTVRFAPTSTPQQLAMAGALCRADPSLYMQTHVAENRDEVRWVSELFPEARSYLDVYARAGLLHRRSLLAHGIWLDSADRVALQASGAQVAHSPSSNLFLGSGLFDWAGLARAGGRVSIASDVGGGTSLSMQRTLAEAYKVQALQGQRLTAWCALHAATRGAAEALGLDDEVGSFEPGRMADLCVWDWSRGAVDAHRLGAARDLHEKVFAWMTLSDERHLRETWVAGQCQRWRPTHGDTSG